MSSNDPPVFQYPSDWSSAVFYSRTGITVNSTSPSVEVFRIPYAYASRFCRSWWGMMVANTGAVDLSEVITEIAPFEDLVTPANEFWAEDASSTDWTPQDLAAPAGKNRAWTTESPGPVWRLRAKTAAGSTTINVYCYNSING